jgi:predicted HTH transcriptional regulator
MTEIEIQKLLDKNETQTLELKKSSGEKVEICQGMILVGIKPDRTVSKVEFTDKSQTDITDLFVKFDPSLTSLVSIEKDLFNGFEILIITVQKSNIDYNCYGNDCYQRVGACNKILTKEEYHQKRLKQTNFDWSAQVCEGGNDRRFGFGGYTKSKK